MFSFCTDPSVLPDWQWFACYLTNATHLQFYRAFGVVLALLAITAPVALGMGLLGALALRSRFAPLVWFGKGYVNIVRGVPDIVFFLFVPIALGQGIEWVMHQINCPDWDQPIRQGNDFIVCREAKVPPLNSAAWVYQLYAFLMAVVAFALVFGAFAANTLHGAMHGCAACPGGNRRSLWHDPRASFPPDRAAADVGLCAARPVEYLANPDQGHAAFVPSGHSGYCLLGARIGRAENQHLCLSAPRLADVVFLGSAVLSTCS
jgi:hypothetical protein